MNILPSIKALLVAAGVTATIKYNKLSDIKGTQIVIIDTGEIAPDPDDTSSVEIEERTFQVFVRGTSYTDVEATCHNIRQALNQKIAVEAEGRHFLNIGITAGLQPITNEVGNYEFSGNFKCRVRNA